jgi:multiple sugar transport system substrate-binding protein
MASRRTFLQGVGGLGLTAMTNGLADLAQAAPEKMWFNTLFHGGDADAMETIVKKITAADSNIQIDLTQGAWTEYYAQLYNSVVAESAPQLGIVDDFRYESVAQVLYDITDTPAGNMLDKMGVKPSDFNQWDISLVGGKPLGIPLDQNGFGIFYNKDIFKQAGLDPEKFPETREEFEKACDAIKKIGKIPYHPALSGETRFIRRAWLGLLWGNNGKFLDGDKPAFNTDKGREALQYLVDGVLKRGWNTPGTNGNNQFLAGELAMVQNGTWFYLTVEKAKLNYGCSMPPKFFERRVAWGGYHLIVVPKQSDSKESIAKLDTTAAFLKAFLPYTSLWGEMGGAVPLFKAGIDNPDLKKTNTWHKTLGMFAQAAASGMMIAEPRHPKITDVDLAIEPFTQQAYNGTMSVKDALDQSEKAVEKVLSGS